MLTNQVDWEIRDQYLLLLENALNKKISGSEFFTKLRLKTYTVIDTVNFLEKHRILLSVDKKASKFGELLEDLTDELEVDELSYSVAEFENFLQQTYDRMKKYVEKD